MTNQAFVNTYRKAFETLCDRRMVQSMYNECEELMHRVLLTLHGEEHTRRRSIELKLFRRDFTRYYEKEVYPRTLAATLAPYLKQGRLDLPDFGFRVNINLSADIAGIDRDPASVEETECLLGIVKTFSEGATLFHSTRDKSVVREEVSAALALFDVRFLQPSRARRESVLAAIASGERDASDAPRDMLTILLENKDEQGLDDAMIRREVAFFMQAAAHSSSNSMVHAFHEIFTWCESHPDDRRRIADDPIFLQRCVHESLRLHPASPVAWRTAACPFHLPTGEEVGEGDSVVIELLQANKDASICGDDADVYNPHRQLADRVPPYALTFGVGLHTCFGRDLAGGALPGPDSNPETHHLGTVTSLVKSLLDHNARPDPLNPPLKDPDTERQNWGSYPVLLDKEKV
jgi:cytochrome P450